MVSGIKDAARHPHCHQRRRGAEKYQKNNKPVKSESGAKTGQ